MLKKHKRKLGRHDRIMGVFQVLWLVFAFLTFVIFVGINVPTKDYDSYLSGWTDEEGNAVTVKEIHDDITIYKQLGKIEKDETIMISAKSLLVHVYIDDELVYQTETVDSKLLGKAPGSYFINISLEKKDSGKEIKIVIDNPYNYFLKSSKISNMIVGDGTYIYKDVISHRIIGAAISFIMIIVGFLMVAFYFPLKKDEMVDKEIIYLGIFTLDMGVFMLNDTQILQLVYGNDYIFHTISQIWMTMLVPPILPYINKLYKVTNYKFSNIISVLCIIFSIILVGGSAIGLYDLHEVIVLTHFEFTVAILYIFYIVIAKNSNNKERLWHYIAVGSFLIGAGADIILLYEANVIETTEFTRFGVLVFITIELCIILVKYYKKMKIDIKNEFLSNLAYHDGLTDLLNRTSFIEEMEYNANNNVKTHFVMFDVNNLKKVNDTYGHLDGDYLIIESSKTIKKCFESIGDIYRTGGDEFVVIVPFEISEEQIKECHENLIEYLKEFNKNINKPYEIHIACGYAMNIDENKSNQDVYNEADKNMYKNKQMLKNKSQ